MESQTKKSTLRTNPRPGKFLSFFSRSKGEAIICRNSFTITPNKDDYLKKKHRPHKKAIHQKT